MSSSPSLFSREQLQENHKGVEDLIPSTVNDFLSYIPEMLKSIEEAYKEGSQEKLTRAAHSLKGAVANVCSEPVRKLAYSIEMLSRDNKRDQIPAQIEKLAQQLGLLEKELENYQMELNKGG